MSAAAIVAIILAAALLGFLAGWTVAERHTLARWEYADAEREEAQREEAWRRNTGARWSR